MRLELKNMNRASISLKKLRHGVLALALLLTFSPQAFGQTSDCASKLLEAQKEFSAGRIELVHKLLRQCLQNGGFNQGQQIQANKLLCLTSLYNNEVVEAEGYLLRFLQLNPEYKLNTAIDPPEFVNIFQRFRHRPVLIWGVSIGAVRAFTVREQFYSLSADPSQSTGEYSQQTGFSAMFEMEYYLSDLWAIHSGVGYQSNSYSYQQSDRFKIQGDYTGYSNLEFKQKQSSLVIPLQIQRNFGAPSRQFFSRLGGEYVFHIINKADVARTDHLGNIQANIEQAGINLNPLRRQHTARLNASAGYRKKDWLGKGWVAVELGFSYGLWQENIAENRYDNTQLIYEFGYIDPDYRRHQLWLKLAYYLPVYKPKLIK
ncbi:hypothetical protein [Persicobacter psychrovividus]|uniref:Uncharacterized protein n=1 Tax=Persicobacter psychrovividus TaxID=387638 RepID=A0ABM7VJZ4_9BACT|nr:hypothetical protein PEPS_36010 [Persicobacter psychrovividus]